MAEKLIQLENLMERLSVEFPDMSFRIGSRLNKKCIIAKKSNYSGADIFVKSDRIELEPCVPDTKHRILIGSGALFLKLFRKSFSEPAKQIASSLEKDGFIVSLR